jgi:hypothetical protein
MGNNLTGQTIASTYEDLVQISGSILTDGTGSNINSLTVTASNATSASYALTSSYAENAAGVPDALFTASISDATITFTKGDASTFGITVNNVVNATSASYAAVATSASHAIQADNANDATTATSASHAVNADAAVSSSFATTALNATSASFASTSTSASYALNATSASHAANATSASYANNAGSVVSASYAANASTADTATTSSYALTASFAENASTPTLQVVLDAGDIATGSIDLLGNVTATTFIGALQGNADTATSASHAVNADSATSATTATSASHAVNADTAANATSASFATTASFASNLASGLNITASNILVNNDLVVNGTASFAYTKTTTGSAVIIGDAFVILNADTPAAPYAGIMVYDTGSASTASFEWNGIGDYWITVEENGDSAIVLTGLSGSKGSEVAPALNKLLKGQGNNTVADSNITDNGTLVTINSNVSASGYVSSSQFVGNLTGTATNATSASYANNATSASHAQNADNATSASYATSALSASYAPDTTFPYTGNAQINGNLSVTGSYLRLSGSLSGSLIDNITDVYSTTAKVNHVVTLTQAEFNAISASADPNTLYYVTDAASFVTSASYALSASYSETSTSSSYALNATSASYALTSTSASHAVQADSATTATTASYVENAVSSSYSAFALSASYSDAAASASHALNADSATSASYALTASNTPFALVTASVDLNTLTFTKGDGSTFNLTVNTGSGGAGSGSFPFIGDAEITGSLRVSGSTSLSGLLSLPLASGSFTFANNGAAVNAGLVGGDVYIDSTDFTLKLVQSASFELPPNSGSLYVTLNDPASYPGTGTTWTDLVGSIDGTIVNSPTYVAGDLSIGDPYYFQLNGTDEHVSFGDNFDTINEFTITMWMSASFSGTVALASKWNDTSDQRCWLLVNETSNLTLYGDRSGNFGSVDSAQISSPGSGWKFIAARYDGNAMILWNVTDNVTDTSTGFGSTGSLFNSSAAIIQGAQSLSAGFIRYFPGRISDFLYSTESFTNAQILTNYSQSRVYYGY